MHATTKNVRSSTLIPKVKLKIALGMTVDFVGTVLIVDTVTFVVCFVPTIWPAFVRTVNFASLCIPDLSYHRRLKYPKIRWPSERRHVISVVKLVTKLRIARKCHLNNVKRRCDKRRRNSGR